MTNRLPSSGSLALLVARGLVALALVSTAVSFATTRDRWPTDIATIFVAAHAGALPGGAPVYDYAALTRLNAAHHYVTGAIYPFTYPPFVLFVARPLTALPFTTVRVLWAAIRVLAVLGNAVLLTDAFVALVEGLGERAAAVRAALWKVSPTLGPLARPGAPVCHRPSFPATRAATG